MVSVPCASQVPTKVQALEQRDVVLCHCGACISPSSVRKFMTRLVHALCLRLTLTDRCPIHPWIHRYCLTPAPAPLSSIHTLRCTVRLSGELLLVKLLRNGCCCWIAEMAVAIV